MTKHVGIAALTLFFAACSYMGGGSGREHKAAFKPPAGAFAVTERVGLDSDKEEKAADKARAEAAPAAAQASTKDSPPAAAIAPEAPTGGLPAALLASGSAREADVRAERIHRLLVQAALSNVKIASVEVSGVLLVHAIWTGRKEPSLQDLSALSKAVGEAARAAVPEAADPEKACAVDLRAADGALKAAWQDGGWKLP